MVDPDFPFRFFGQIKADIGRFLFADAFRNGEFELETAPVHAAGQRGRQREQGIPKSAFLPKRISMNAPRRGFFRLTVNGRLIWPEIRHLIGPGEYS